MNFGAWPSSLSSLYIPSISNLLHGYVLKYRYTEMIKTLLNWGIPSELQILYQTAVLIFLFLLGFLGAPLIKHPLVKNMLFSPSSSIKLPHMHWYSLLVALSQFVMPTATHACCLLSFTTHIRCISTFCKLNPLSGSLHLNYHYKSQLYCHLTPGTPHLPVGSLPSSPLSSNLLFPSTAREISWNSNNSTQQPKSNTLPETFHTVCSYLLLWFNFAPLPVTVFPFKSSFSF